MHSPPPPRPDDQLRVDIHVNSRDGDGAKRLALARHEVDLPGLHGTRLAPLSDGPDRELVAPDDGLHGVPGRNAMRGRDDELRGDQRAAAELEEAALWFVYGMVGSRWYELAVGCVLVGGYRSAPVVGCIHARLPTHTAPPHDSDLDDVRATPGRRLRLTRELVTSATTHLESLASASCPPTILSASANAGEYCAMGRSGRAGAAARAAASAASGLASTSAGRAQRASVSWSAGRKRRMVLCECGVVWCGV